MRALGALALVLLAAPGSGAAEDRIDRARAELLDALPPDETLSASDLEREAQATWAEEALDDLRLLDCRVRVLNRSGNAVAAAQVRVRHEVLDIGAGPVATDTDGYAPVRLPRGSWRIDAARCLDGARGVVFGSASVEVTGSGTVALRMDSRRKVRFIRGSVAAPKPDLATLATADLSHVAAFRPGSETVEILTCGTGPLIAQGQRVPDHGAGYVVRGEVPPDGASIPIGPRDASVFRFEGARRRAVTAGIENVDALPLDLRFTTNGDERVVVHGVPRVAVSMEVDRDGRTYSFYPRPFEVDGTSHGFSGEPPFDVSVGIVRNTSRLYKGRRGSLTLRVFLRDRNGLIVSDRARRDRP